MAAPTLSAEGALNVVTTGNNTPTVPAHAANDILICTVGAWMSSGSFAFSSSTATGWNPLFGTGSLDIGGGGSVRSSSGVNYGFWLRATGSSHTITVARPTTDIGGAWGTGNTTAFGARVYVVSGCITTGTPWDDIQKTADPGLTAANGAVPAVTVSGSDRTVIQFLVRQDDYVTAPTLTGWTAGTQVESTTGADMSMASFRKENVSASTSADTSTNEAPVAPGMYSFFGISFIPAAAAETPIIDPMGRSGFFGA